MKKKAIQITLITSLILGGSQLFASNTNAIKSTIVQNDSTVESFKVYGNCGMCKKTIEGALKGEKGINSAVWNKDTKQMEVNFDESKISLDEIKKKIALVGYDTEEYRSTEENYSKLPGCCQYDRPEKK